VLGRYREWLIGICSRYVWSGSEVVSARVKLFSSLRGVGIDAYGVLTEEVASSMMRYVRAFNMVNAISRLEGFIAGGGLERASY